MGRQRKATANPVVGTGHCTKCAYGHEKPIGEDGWFHTPTDDVRREVHREKGRTRFYIRAMAHIAKRYVTTEAELLHHLLWGDINEMRTDVLGEEDPYNAAAKLLEEQEARYRSGVTVTLAEELEMQRQFSAMTTVGPDVEARDQCAASVAAFFQGRLLKGGQLADESWHDIRDEIQRRWGNGD